MSRSWAALLMLVAAGCGDSTTNGVATDPSDRVALPTEATSATTAVSPAPVSPAPVSSGPVSSGDVPTDVPNVVPEGFGTIAARVSAADGEVCELCLWLADDAATRARGLMQVTDLGGLDGMAFRYDSPHTTSFTMRNTVMPLSIAFFGADGGRLTAFDMEPCAGEPCPSYPTPGDFVVAVEVPAGGLPELAIGAGSTLELLAEGCSSTTPP
ncbi:MAG TPA: DUF192 domain-containing protein [Ilumatobacteraceae bacterium]|nr:DUF192 domain-containing protein [Ilumatobacteraceae bacterium]